MKKSLFIVSTAMLFAACEKNLIDAPAMEPTGKMTIKASIENVETRTTIDYTSGTDVDYSAGEISKWVAGDQIRVYFYDTDGDEQGDVVFKAKTGGTNVEFEIDDTESNTLPANGTYTAKAVYPKDAADTYISYDAQTQDGENLGHLGDYDLMTAQASVQVGEGDIAFDLAFTHRLSLLRFSLLNDTGGDITISEINIRSGNSNNAFLISCLYDIDGNDIDRYYTSDASLAVDNSPIMADGGTFDGYMISANTVLDDTDNVIVSITFNNGVNDGIQEFTIPRVGNAFLLTEFEGGKRYYFKLKLTEATFEQGNYGGLNYRFNTTEKRATILGFATPATSLNIPATVLHNEEDYDVFAIGNYAFEYTDLTGVTFAAGSRLTTIGDWAFYDCTSLTGTLAIPASVISIGEGAFACTDLTTINMYCTTPPTLGSNIFNMVSGLTINVPQSAAGAYSTEINNKTKGWSHTGTLPVTLVAGGSVTLPNLGEADGDVTVSATL